MGINYRYNLPYRVLAAQYKHVDINNTTERDELPNFLPPKPAKFRFNHIRVDSIGNFHGVFYKEIQWSGNAARTKTENRRCHYHSSWNVLPLELFIMDFLWRRLRVELLVCMVPWA